MWQYPSGENTHAVSAATSRTHGANCHSAVYIAPAGDPGTEDRSMVGTTCDWIGTNDEKGTRMARTKILDEDMANNRAKLIPIAICVDRSWSMDDGTKKPDLEAGLKKFYSDIEADPRTRYGADLCLIGFSGEPAVMQPFTGIDSVERDVVT